MLGFPNVGKSALINRLVRQKVVNSARRAGVTRTLRWVRLGQALDLLDAPGVLPPRLENKQAALLLAYCDDIGQAAYNVEAVALAFLQLLSSLEGLPLAGVPKGLLEQRYGIPLAPLAAAGDDLAEDVLTADFEICTGRIEAKNLGEEPASNPNIDSNSDPNSALNAHPDLGTWLERAAARHTGGDTTRMASKLLDDFRRNALGPITLELPPADG
jgi:ribosome biogenesis GTPase A